MQTKGRGFILWIEGLGFGLILVLAWLAEILGVPHYLFSEPTVIHWGRPLIKSVVIICVWAAVHISTRRLLKRLYYLEDYLRICAWCRKMDHDGAWVTMEDYFGSAFATKTSHGVCPECSGKLEKSGNFDNARRTRKSNVAQGHHGSGTM
jgi:hypothetical protein